jgi:flagellar biosynthesis/type III secretory pathway protein FliH
VDAEGTTLLYKIIKGERANQNSTTKPYCFPDIPAKASSNIEENVDKESGFQHIEFEENGMLPPGWLEESPGSGKFVEAARTKAKHIEEQAFVQGFTQGEKAGLESGKKKIEPVLHNFRQALSELEKIKREIYGKIEQETVELALAVAKKVVCHEVSTNKEVILSIVREALKKVVDTEKIKIRINRSDLQFLNQEALPFSNIDEDMGNITLEEDDTILTGGCIIETNFGDIDARVEKQLQVVEEAFRSEFNKSGTGD